MLQVFDLSKSYSARNLFQNVTFTVGKGERIGLVGRNGCGKSTLFKIILEEETSDSGTVSVPKGYTIGNLDQHINFSKDTVIDECCQVLSEEEQFDYYKAEKILFGLGFTEEDMFRSPHEFSGGYQLRINLTKTLLKNPDLLLLDEPTNYLDIVSLRWLRRFLKSFPGEAIIITHDRDFMDTATTHTMGIHRGSLSKTKGSTDKFYTQLALDEEIYEKTRQNQEKKVKHMQHFVDRFGAKNTKAKQAQSKLKQIAKISVLERLNSELTLGFRFSYKNTPAKILMAADKVGFSYSGSDDNLLFSDLSFDVKPGDCIAIIGKNGKGKTTLLNALAGSISPTHGEVNFHPQSAVGYYQQTNRKNLDPNNTIADEIAAENVDLGVAEVRGICGAMMFSGSDADKKIKVLSGGEQGRVLLGKILAHSSNLLFLDEPSNHLDMDSIEVLINEVDNFPGGVVVVTHNEDMLRKLANKLIIFRDGGAEIFNGSYDEFLEKIGWEEEGPTKQNKKNNINKKDAKKLRGEIVNARSKELKPFSKKVEKLEKDIAQLEAEMASKNSQVMQLIESQAEGSQIQEIYKLIGEIQLKLNIMYEEIMLASEKIELITASYETKLNELN